MSRLREWRAVTRVELRVYFPYTGIMANEAHTRGRPKTADGRRELVTARVSESKFAAIKAACGDMSRSAWVEAAIDAYLSPPPLPVVPPAREPSREPDASPVPVYGYAEESGDAESVYGNEGPPCRHPADQVEAGECRSCGADVW